MGKKMSMDIKHTIFDGMESWNALGEAKIALENAKLEKVKICNEIESETKKAYYSLDKNIKSYAIHKEMVDRTSKYFSVLDKAVADDLVSKEEYLKVKGLNLQIDFQEKSAKEDMLLAERTLFQALNMEPGESKKIRLVDSPKNIVSIGLENCYELAMANNPEVRIKANNIRYYDKERKAQKAKNWPKVEFDGSFGSAIERYEPLFLESDYDVPDDNSGPVMSGRDWEPEWYAGVKTSIPFWGSTLEHNYVREQWAPTVSAFRGSQSATNYLNYKILDNMESFVGIEEARSNFAKAITDYDKAKNETLMGVKDAYFKYRKAIIQMQVSMAQMEHQESLVNILEQRNRFGDMEASRVLEEAMKLGEEKYSLVQSDFDYYTSIVAVNQSVGVPGYFKPEYESQEFDTWQVAQDKKAAEEKAANEAKKAKRGLFFGMFGQRRKSSADPKKEPVAAADTQPQVASKPADVAVVEDKKSPTL
ncbi:MAG: TolC family protein [Candidatus Omnitrophica bacterium]|nr:TolC family protein [Candidatus Omnitrophota bacterium]